MSAAQESIDAARLAGREMKIKNEKEKPKNIYSRSRMNITNTDLQELQEA